MNLRSPWVAVPVALTAALVFYIATASGSSGLWSLFFLLFLTVGLVGPLFAAVRLGSQAVESPSFRRRLLALLAFPAAAGLVVGGMAGVEGDLFFAVVLVFMATAALAGCALLATAASRPGGPGREGIKEAARSLWTLVLAGGVFCCVSLPAGWATSSYTMRNAKSWVEAAAAEVRAVQKNTGRVPVDLQEVLQRVGPAPHGCRSRDGGYEPSPDQGTFRFVIQAGRGLDFSWWIFNGRTGEWKFEAD